MKKRHSRRFLSWPLLIVLCLGWSGCEPLKNVSLTQNDPNADYFAVIPLAVNPRFELVPAQSLLRSDALWMRGGTGPNDDKVGVQWHDMSFLSNKQGVTCNFLMPNADCERCNVCRTTDTPSSCSTPNLQWAGFNPIQIISFPGYMTQMPPSSPREPLPTDGCEVAANNIPNILIDSPSNATYQLKLHPAYYNANPMLKIAPFAETRLHVINGGKETLKYELTHLPQPQTSDTLKFFSGTVPDGVGDALRDNFSSRLAVGKVRVLKGTPETDPVTGDLSLGSASVVQASRLVFINNFHPSQISTVLGNDGIHCYGRYSTSLPEKDGDFDLTQCRLGTASAGQDLPATPVYLKSAPNGFLTWIVEFNQNDFGAIGGGEMPMLESGQVLAIEFTIQ